ncbi:hypothetical protein [Halorussus amylolyticus]|uniref:hypothetical protein n=1 Tax=Halorussus amylolyticus TaxID=1126242 RepID=UPI001044847F|nr:hypothetical protein [Halorussus amylolyticus]
MNTSALVVGATALALLAAGVSIARGNLWLLANYDPERAAGDSRVARVTGGTIVAYGVVTAGLAVALRRGPVADGWWLAWTLLTLIVAFGVAAVASGRA